MTDNFEGNKKLIDDWIKENRFIFINNGVDLETTNSRDLLVQQLTLLLLKKQLELAIRVRDQLKTTLESI